MILTTRIVNVPSQRELDADRADQAEEGREYLAAKLAAQFGEAAVEAGAPDYPDGERPEAIKTGATDAIANILHLCEAEGIDPSVVISSAEGHFDAEH